MIKRGEVNGEVKEDKSLVVFKDGRENREVTKAEAIKLGIIEAEDIGREEEIDSGAKDDASELAEVAPITNVKSQKSKMPLYVSVAGLATVIIGAFMNLVQWRRPTR